MRNSYANGFGLNSFDNKKYDLAWSVYKNDGSGRDTYISFDNGGFHKPRQTAPKMNIDSSQNNTFSFDVRPQILGKHINYLQNGTGRDSYIFMSNGGFYPQKTAAQYTQNFQDQLRVSHFQNQQPTNEYMQRRKKKLSNFQKESMLSVFNDNSPDNDFKKAQLIDKIQIGSKSNIIYHQPRGYITNKQYLERRDYKEMYQTMHSNLLAQPKNKNMKYNSRYISLDKQKEPINLNQVFQQDDFPRINEFDSQKLQRLKNKMELLSPQPNRIVFQKENLDFKYQRRERKKKQDLLNTSLALQMLKGNYEDSINLLSSQNQNLQEGDFLKATARRLNTSNHQNRNRNFNIFQLLSEQKAEENHYS